MSNALYRLGSYAARRPWVVIGTWVAAVLLVVAASAGFGRELTDSMAVPGLDSQHAVDLLTSAESDQAGLTGRVVMTPKDDTATFFDSEIASGALAEAQAAFADLPSMIATSDPSAALAAGPEEAIASGSISPDGTVAILQLQYPVVEHMSPDDLEALVDLQTELSATTPLQVEVAGELFFVFEDGETANSELFGIIAAVIILLVAFGSVIAMGLPIGMALFGLAFGVTSMSLVTHLIDIPAFAPQMATMIGLGVGIDYALFLVTRHREFLADGLGVVESAGRAVATSGLAVVFAGGTVVIAILGLSVAGIPFMTAAGVATSVIVGMMVVASITLLPAFLGLVGHRIEGRLFRRRASVPTNGVSARWQRWGSHVSKHAWSYVIGTTALLVLFTAPVLDLWLGYPDDGNLPETRTERRAYDLVAEGFGPGVNGPLMIAVDISEDGTIVEPLAQAIAADPGMMGVAAPVIDHAAGVATIIAIPHTSPQDEATVDTVERLRSDVIPTILADSPARAHVGGQTASFADVSGKVTDRLPWFVAAVVSLSFVLLTVVFRSLLVPLKAAILNLLSIGAAYGVLVAVFQWGWGADLIGLESTIPVVSFIPLFMFAVLFGLSMDYEVFLLSRVREEYRRTGDNQQSVITGLAKTARVITSAAAIMISVFLAFVIDPNPMTKMVGLGLATAIFVDATVVRLVLVPATMQLMGDANWWLPSWLDRLLPTIDIDGHASDAVPEPEPIAA